MSRIHRQLLVAGGGLFRVLRRSVLRAGAAGPLQQRPGGGLHAARLPQLARRVPRRHRLLPGARRAGQGQGHHTHVS